MQAKGVFPKFWRRPQNGVDAPDQAKTTEASVNQSQTRPAEGLTGPKNDLLSYEDIYHAAGILSPRSGYGIHKVVEMLNNDRIRNRSKDIQRGLQQGGPDSIRPTPGVLIVYRPSPSAMAFTRLPLASSSLRAQT